MKTNNKTVKNQFLNKLSFTETSAFYERYTKANKTYREVISKRFGYTKVDNFSTNLKSRYMTLSKMNNVAA